MDIEVHRQRLADALSARGCWPVDSPWVREAMSALPRDLFAPDRLWVWDGEDYAPVDRATAPERWVRAVFAGPYDSAVTQVVDGLPASSLSCVSVVADMLDALMAEPGHRILELGTGSGWNAALLAARAGAGHVTSVEVDAWLADAARERLKAAGAGVDVCAGDGAGGWPGGAPYDRLIATYAVDEVPWPWVEQTRPGGRLVLPWGRLGHIALTVAGDGRSASGWFQGLGMFMPSRGTGQGKPFHEVRGDGQPDTQDTPSLEPHLLRDGNLLFALRVLLPDVRISTETSGTGTRAWIHDGHSSWATLTPATDSGTAATAYRGGPRRLDDELTRAWQHWQAAGAPGLYDFGMTRTPTEQYIWTGDKDTGPRWQPLASLVPHSS